MRFSSPRLESLNTDPARGVVIGRDGNLFLLDGSNHLMRYTLGIFSVRESRFESQMKTLQHRSEVANNVGAKYWFFCLPNKETVLADEMGVEGIVSVGSEFEKRLCEFSDSSPFAFIKTPKQFEGRSTYFKYDTHTNDNGALFHATEICRHLTGEMFADFMNVERVLVRSDFRGDLGQRFVDCEGEQQFRFPVEERILKFNNKIRNRGNLKVYENSEAKSADTILLFGDSFSWAVAPLLAIVFRKVVFLHSPHCHAELIHEVRPNHVLNVQVERFLPSDIDDNDAAPFLIMAAFEGKLGRERQREAIEHCYFIRPNSLRFRIQYSSVLAQTGRRHEARKLMFEGPTHRPDAQIWLARLDIASKDYARASERLSRVLSEDETILEAYAHKAEAEYRRGNLDEALAYMDMALELRPNDRAMLLRRSELLSQTAR